MTTQINTIKIILSREEVLALREEIGMLCEQYGDLWNSDIAEIFREYPYLSLFLNKLGDLIHIDHDIFSVLQKEKIPF